MSCKTTEREFKAIVTKHACLFKDYPTEIPRAFNDFIARMNEIPNRTNTTVALYEPGNSSPQPDSMETFYVGVLTDDFSVIPEGMMARRIPSREYATITHKGEIFKIGDSYMELGSWISREGYKQVSDWVVELYDERFNPASSESEMEIYTPISRL